MTLSDRGLSPTQTPTKVLRDRVTTIEWLRRRLAVSAPACAAELAVLLAPVNQDAALRTYASRDLFEWLDTMVLLVDRDADSLLPDGHFAAHAASVVNLTAGVAGPSGCAVHLDRYGDARLPGCGVIVSGGPRLAGLVRYVDLEHLDPQFVATPINTPARADAAQPAADPPAQEVYLVDTELVDDVVRRWVEAGGRAAGPRAPMATSVAPDELTGLLTRAGLPMTVPPNPESADAIRQDASFDHLSLLSVRRPELFAELRTNVEHYCDPYSRRLAGHCAYIGRDYTAAEEIYAELLMHAVEDVDLWRDLCWALRHGGDEDLARVWVLHPKEVVRVAVAVDFASPRELLERLRSDIG